MSVNQMQFAAKNIAELIGGTIEGDAGVLLNTFAKIEEAQPGALTFLANPKYTHYLYSTKASAVLVNNDFVPAQPVSATLIRVADPYKALSQLMTMVAAAMQNHPIGIEQPSYIAQGATIGNDVYVGAFAYIGSGAVIGDGAKIYPQAYLGNGVKVGNGTIIYPGVKIYAGCTIGSGCILHSGVVIGGDGFGFAPNPDGSYSKIPQLGIVEIQDNVEIGANTTVDRATMGKTIVGQGTKLDNLIQIAHNVTVGRNTVMASQVGVAGSAKIGDNCIFGGQVGISGHIEIGNHVTIGPQSGVEHSIAQGEKVMGSPTVQWRQFARQSACIKRLPDMFKTLNDLEKKMNK